jgi:LysR family glycine cleavage system transcriptional activator
MSSVSHLKALQALELAVREKSLRAAANRLGISAAAVGQRIRALEDHLGTALLMRGRSGLEPSPGLAEALPDLHAAFAALERASDTLDLRRPSEIHIVADPDWAELWLAPRLATFRQLHPNILFNINGLGDVPMRLGAPDLRVSRESGTGEVLFADLFVAITGPDNLRRLIALPDDWQLEGMPLLHMRPQREGLMPGWVEWCRVHGQRSRGSERGVVYANARLALAAVRENIGFLLCGLALCQPDLEAGRVVLAFPAFMHVATDTPYRLTLRSAGYRRPQTDRFLAWLRSEASLTASRLRAAQGNSALANTGQPK